MSNLVVDSYLSIIDRMDLDSKLALLAGLTESIRTSINKPAENKLERFNALYGVWEDMDDSIVEDIYAGRMIPEDDITFD